MIIFVLLSSCSKQFIQIFDTSSNNSKLTDGFWVYETDSIKLTYVFWANKGVMSFSVYNKLDKPIYIDWKNSSFIYNSNKLNYWIDEQQSSIASYYGSYYYNGPLIKPGFTINEGVQVSSSTTVKPERITFIPPKSYYYRSQFYLLPIDYFKINDSLTKTVGPRNDNAKKKTIVYEKKYDNSSSPLKFRNYLAFTFTENSSDFLFTDNEFYLSSVKEMDYRHFRGIPIKTADGEKDYSKPFKKKTSFYITIDPTKSIEYNSKLFFKIIF